MPTATKNLTITTDNYTFDTTAVDPNGAVVATTAGIPCADLFTLYVENHGTIEEIDVWVRTSFVKNAEKVALAVGREHLIEGYDPDFVCGCSITLGRPMTIMIMSI